MGVTIRDASLLTQKKRNMAQHAYYDAWKTATNAGNTATTNPARSTAEVLSEISLGCTACVVNSSSNVDPNMVRYPTNPSSGGNTEQS